MNSGLFWTSSALCALGLFMRAATADAQDAGSVPAALKPPLAWELSPILIAPENRTQNPSVSVKDPSVVFDGGKWHVFMTIRCDGWTPTEYLSFDQWENAAKAPRTILKLTDSKYYCAPQVFYFAPHKKWYLICQMGVPGAKKMWVAFSTTANIADPGSWTQARPILDGGPDDPRKEGGLDYWISCDDRRAYLFFTSLNGKLWRMWTPIADFPRGFDHCELALQADIFEAAHIYRLKGMDRYLALIEAQGKNARRYYKGYLADRLDGNWTPLADSEQNPFAGAANVRPAPGSPLWTDNVSHGELLRDSNDQTLTVDPAHLRFLIQGALDSEKAGIPYGKIPWRIGLLSLIPPPK